jgi:hypothetical protein
VAALHHTFTHKQYTLYRERKIGKCGPCPVFESYTLTFALQLRKKHGKTSVRVAQYKNNEAQYKNNDTVTRTMNSKCHRTTKNTEYTTEKTVHCIQLLNSG